MKTISPGSKSQYLVYIYSSLITIFIVSVLYLFDNSLYIRLLGSLNPIWASVAVASIGAITLPFLLSKGFVIINKNENLKKIIINSSLAIIFALITIIVIDIKFPFSENINVFWPRSLFFYPSIGFLVEVLFHVIPFSLLLFILKLVFKNVSHSKIVWICIVVVATFEPIFQTIGMESFPLWITVITWINLYLLNLYMLYSFKRYSFISMYSVRVIYYIVWHILWGYLRLKFLF